MTYIGSSNFAGWNIAQACERARQRHFLGLVCDQSLYNLNDRMVELEVIPACREYGLGLLAYMPLDGGLLAGTLKKAEAGRRTPAYDSLDPKLRAQVDAWESLCRDLGNGAGPRGDRLVAEKSCGHSDNPGAAHP